MTLPAWPSGVPHIPKLDDQQDIERVIPPIVTDMEGGNQRQRARPGDNIGVLPYVLQMSIAQFETFQTWWKTTLSLGTARFTMDVFDGTACVNKVCQFTSDGRPKSRYIDADVISVSMQLRVYDI